MSEALWETCRRSQLFAREGGDEGVDLLLVGTLAARVEAWPRAVADPQHDLIGPWRIVDQHRRRVDGVKVPARIERAIEEIDTRAGRAHLGVPRNDDASAPDGATHGHAEARMDHGGAMLEVTGSADQGRLGVGPELSRFGLQRIERRFGKGNAEGQTG